MKTFDASEFREDLEINKADLDDAFMKQASMFAHYARIYSEMLVQEQNAKLDTEILYAKLDKELREEASLLGKKITEKQIESSIITDPRYVAAMRQHIEARGIKELAHAATDAFTQRRDMLIQLGANSRGEMKGDLVSRAARVEEMGSKLKWSEKS